MNIDLDVLRRRGSITVSTPVGGAERETVVKIEDRVSLFGLSFRPMEDRDHEGFAGLPSGTWMNDMLPDQILFLLPGGKQVRSVRMRKEDGDPVEVVWQMVDGWDIFTWDSAIDAFYEIALSAVEHVGAANYRERTEEARIALQEALVQFKGGKIPVVRIGA
jgi:hypothetical protein